MLLGLPNFELSAYCRFVDDRLTDRPLLLAARPGRRNLVFSAFALVNSIQLGSRGVCFRVSSLEPVRREVPSVYPAESCVDRVCFCITVQKRSESC